MFTNNYIALQHNLSFGVNGPGIGIIITNTETIWGKGVTSPTGSALTNPSNHSQWGFGRTLANVRCNSLPESGVSSEGSAMHGVYFGSGNTPAQKTDYKLESPITSGMSVGISEIAILEETSERYSISGLYTVRNTSDAEININEVGCFALVKSGSYYPVLIERTVLSDPITIAPGEAKLVTYKVTFNRI